MPRRLRFFSSQPMIEVPGLVIRACAVREPMPPSVIHRPEGTGDYLLMLFHHTVKAGWNAALTKEIQPGSLMIWQPGECQFYGHPRRGYLHTWLHCDGALVTQLLGNDLPVQTPHLLPTPAPFEKLVKDLYREAHHHFPPDPVITANLLENGLRDLRRHLSGPQAKAPPERLLRVKSVMDTRFSEPLTLHQLAAMAHWSVGHFSEVFREYYQTSPMDYLIRQRMHRAAYLLRNVHQNVGEVGRAVGYEDPYHFSRLFKRHMGVSPRQMRPRKAVMNSATDDASNRQEAARSQ